MLTRLTIRNFKRFGEVEVELGNPVVFIGPNNSGKTTAMQALALWEVGVKRWNEKRGGKSTPESRPGVTVNRRDLYAMPHPSANLLWRDRRVRDAIRVDGRQRTSNVRVDIVVEGVSRDKAWECGLEFDYANEESFYCRPLRLSEEKSPQRMPVPPEAVATRIVLLPPMSGLAATETRLDQGAVNVRVGEGRTAEVLRNLCYQVYRQGEEGWSGLAGRIEALFGVELDEPRYVEERGEIAMWYRERGVTLDLSSAGRGLQQTLLLLAYMHANPGAVILLDEPDAHLEILRQREIYRVLSEVASEHGNQIVAASHSEVLLNEAAGRDLVIAFVGSPHPLGRGNSEVRKALAEIGFDQYLQAEQKGWVLYLEGSTDLAVLQAFARRLGRTDICKALERPFVRYVGNQPLSAARHFHGLKEAVADLKGVALFDRLDRALPDDPVLVYLAWNKREIGNYLCTRSTLDAYARNSALAAEPAPLFAPAEVDRRLDAMSRAIDTVGDAMQVLGQGSPWDGDVKVSDLFLGPLFSAYFAALGVPNLMDKRNFHVLAGYVPEEEMDPEIGEKFDAIARVAASARPASDG